MAFRPLFLAAALLSSVAACGGDDCGGGTVTPEGTHYKYVANKVLIPTSNTQAKEYGLDLNGDKTVDNQLGQVLSTLQNMGFELQPTIDAAVAEGSIILLLDMQTKDFNNTSAAGISAYLGDQATASPAPCNTDEVYNPDTMMGCGRHLTGGTFTLSANSPTDVALGGKIVNGTFNGGPGKLTLQIALGGTDAIRLDLIGARIKGSMLSEAGLGSLIVGGAISKNDIDTKIIPAIQTQLVDLIARDCTDLATPPDCGCADGSTGKTVLGLFDIKKADGTDGKDCNVTVDEIKNNSLIVSLLSPDVEIDGVQALSLGIKATALPATFTVPGQQ